MHILLNVATVQRPIKVLIIPIIAGCGMGAVLDVESILSATHSFVANMTACHQEERAPRLERVGRPSG